MDPNPDTTPQQDGRLSRAIPGFTSLSRNLRSALLSVTEPLSPSRSEFSFASAPSTPGLEKFRGWSSHRRSSADAERPTTTTTTTVVTPAAPLTLMTLPPELQIMILSFLAFGDIQRLRFTSTYWAAFATPRLVRSIYGPDTFRAMLMAHCRACLAYCPRGVHRLATTPLDPGYPLSSRCVACTVQSRDGTVRVGRRVTLGNLADYWACRWCGWPVTDAPASAHPQFHHRCYERYAAVLLAFFLLGWVQFLIGVVAAALAWRYFPRNTAILASTVVGFVLTWACIILIMFRGNRVRTYHWALLMELSITGLWIPTCYFIGRDLAAGAPTAAPRRPAEAIIAFVALNMAFRLLNIIGNIVLVCEYDRTRHYVPRIPIWRRFMNPILTALIFWTYPQHAERKFGPDWA